MLRREFLAAGTAGIFFPVDDRPPALTPDPRGPEKDAFVSESMRRFGFDPVKCPKGRLYQLPKSKVKRIAWTVDDGTSVASLREYLNFVEKFDLRMTFFITSTYPSWRKNRTQLQELVDEGRVQLANHTHTHPSLTGISTSAIQRELRKCGRFIEDTFGVEAKPYFRPPYGRIDSRVIAAAKDVGYRIPVMWSGSLGDNFSQRRRSILTMGNKWIQNRTILLDHVNDHTSKHTFRHLERMLRRRKLVTVTLDDVFLT